MRTPSLLPGSLRLLAVAALLVLAVYSTGAGVWRDLAAGRFSGDLSIDWVPFRSQFHAAFPVMLADILKRLVVYAVVTAACLVLALDRGRAIALLLLFGMVSATECARAILSGHHASTTTLLLALTAWLVTTRAWESLRPRVAKERRPGPAPAGSASAGARVSN